MKLVMINELNDATRLLRAERGLARSCKRTELRPTTGV